MKSRAFACLAFAFALVLSGNTTSATAGVINNVLLQWRANERSCTEPTRTDATAMMHVAMFEAVNSIARKYTPYVALIPAAPGSSADAAAAAAAHDVLVSVCPGAKTVFDAALKKSLDLVRDSSARENGAAVGRKAAEAVIAARAKANAPSTEPYFIATTPGVYVSTGRQVGIMRAKETPWIMTRPDEFRPVPPPALGSAAWARDFDEIKRMGGRKSEARTVEQTDIARFWAPRDVRIVLRQLVGLPGRSLVDDARFLALAEMAHEDSYVSMMDGKYAHNFWRPITAIRGGAVDGNDATAADSTWEPLVNTPPHPEYPCGHCLSAAAVGTVIAKEFGNRMPTIVLDVDSTMLRRFTSAQEYIDEVSEARLLAGVHYRTSVNAGKAMGVSIGNSAYQRWFKPSEAVARAGQ